MSYVISSILFWVFVLAYFAFPLLSDQYHKILADRSPFPYTNARADLRNYYGATENKAFAASVSLSSWGWSFGHPDAHDAERVALEYCEETRGERCLLYALGNRVVWDGDLARRALDATVSSQALHGEVWRFYGETNPHGLALAMPPEAPSIVSDYHSARGVKGRLRAQFPGTRARHRGIDIIAPKGSSVLAAADGEVLISEFKRVGGLTIRIAHHAAEDQTAMVTGYIHLDQSFVEPGDIIIRGQVIGTVGVSGTGANAARPHLHFVNYGSNPHLHWLDGQGQITCFEPDHTYTPAQTSLTYPVPCGPAEEVLQIVN